VPIATVHKMTTRLLIISLTFILTSCRQQTESTSFDIQSLPSDWTEVEEKNGEWVIFKPCDAEVFGLTLMKDQISVKWGQELEEIKIIEAKQNADSSITISAKNGDLTDTFQFSLSSSKTLWTITTLGGTVHKKYLIPSKDTSNYKKVDQPCEECWDKDICDSLKKNK